MLKRVSKVFSLGGGAGVWANKSASPPLATREGERAFCEGGGGALGGVVRGFRA